MVVSVSESMRNAGTINHDKAAEADNAGGAGGEAPSGHDSDRANKTARHTKSTKKFNVNCSTRSAGPVVRMACEKAGWKFSDVSSCSAQKEASLLWVITEDDFCTALQTNKPTQIYNRIPGMKDVMTKVSFSSLMKRAQQLHPEHYSFWPQSFELPSEAKLLQAAMCPKGTRNPTTFIVKPDAGSQGDGIFLCQDYDSLSSRLPNSRAGDLVAQRYISDPLLVDGLKFDLRIYAVVSRVAPTLQVHVCKEGLARFCTMPYSEPTASNLHNITSHLTNYSVNKRSAEFEHSDDPTGDDSTKRSMTSVFSKMRASGVDVGAVWDSILSLVQATMTALHPTLLESADQLRAMHANIDERAFQILGFDVLLDSKLQPWLLEVNGNPSLSLDAVFTADQYRSVVGEDMVASALSMATGPQAQRALARRGMSHKERVPALPNVGSVGGAGAGGGGGSGDVSCDEAGEAGRDVIPRVCRCMDSHEPHFHQDSAVDVAVKLAAVERAIKIARKQLKSPHDSVDGGPLYDSIATVPMPETDGVSLDVLNDLQRLYGIATGPRRKLDSYKLRTFAERCGVPKSAAAGGTRGVASGFCLSDVDVMFTKKKRAASATASTCGCTEFVDMAIEMASRMRPDDKLHVAVGAFVQAAWAGHNT